MEKQHLYWRSVGQLTLGLIVIISLWGISIVLIGWGFSSLLIQSGLDGQTLPNFMMAISLGAVGLLMMPSVYYALMRILGRPAVDSRIILSRLKPGWWIFVLPVVIGLGYLVLQAPSISWLLLPPLHVLAVGIPIVWMLSLALRRLPSGSSQRIWGVYDSGMSLAPFLIMVLEIMAGLALIVVLAIYLSTRSDMLESLLDLFEKLRGIGSQDEAIEILAPLMMRPLVIGAVFIFAALVVPVIEEVFKPIGVWLLAGQKISPQAGFVAGALSGAGYGFVESLVLTGNGQDWVSLVIARAGTASVHILTAALTGWALVQAWQRKRFLRLALAYLCAVIIHGLWNSLTIAFSFVTLAQLQKVSLKLPFIGGLGMIAPLGLLLIAAGCTIGLAGANRYLRRGKGRRVGSEIQPAEGETGESVL